MAARISRRCFVKSSLIGSAVIPLAVHARGAEPASGTPAVTPAPEEPMPVGMIAGQPFSRLFLGGNLIGGHAHARELAYVSPLMRRYNTPAKIRETLELAENNGITAMNSWVMDDNAQLFEHWKAGGKMQWFAQARLDGGGGFSQLQRAIDEGAVAVHLTGDTCESLLSRKEFEKVTESIAFIKSRKRIAGVAAHDLRVIVECERLKLDVDFYQKTFHTLDYFTAPQPGSPEPLGPHDNSWCNDPQAVIDCFARVNKPWIAFKILAAGGIPPRAAFPHAINNGADFLLVGMFDWQVAENARLARRVVAVAAGPNTKRTRPWVSQATPNGKA